MARQESSESSGCVREMVGRIEQYMDLCVHKFVAGKVEK